MSTTLLELNLVVGGYVKYGSLLESIILVNCRA